MLNSCCCLSTDQSYVYRPERVTCAIGLKFQFMHELERRMSNCVLPFFPIVSIYAHDLQMLVHLHHIYAIARAAPPASAAFICDTCWNNLRIALHLVGCIIAKCSLKTLRRHCKARPSQRRQLNHGLNKLIAINTLSACVCQANCMYMRTPPIDVQQMLCT